MPFPSRSVPALLGAFLFSSALSVPIPGAFAAPSHSAPFDTSAQKVARRAIAANYLKAAAAIRRKDLGALDAMEAPDYRSYSPGGKVLTREQDALEMRQFLAGVNRVLKMENRILSLTWRGQDAVVVAQNTGVFLVKQGGRTLRLETVDVSRDFWSQTAKGWQIRQVVHGPGKTWVNGKRTG